jgi:signal transduction histidine kinase
MDDMTTSGRFAAAHGERLRANWPALLLPLVAVDTVFPFEGTASVLLVIVAVALAVLAPRQAAKITPYAFLAYGAYGLFMFHSLMRWEAPPGVYGVLRVSTSNHAGYVLPQAFACLVAGVWLLAVTGAPGGAVVRRVVSQLRGTDGQPKSVPPLLLLPVLFLCEELFSNQLWFDWGNEAAPLFGLLLAVGAVVLVRRVPRAAAGLAVAGLLLFGLYGVLDGAVHLPPGSSELWLAGTNNYGRWIWGWTYGAVPLDTGLAAPAAMIQGAVLFGAGCALAPRLLTWSGDLELARRAQLLTQRVTRLTQTRSDATEVAVAELRRIERDLHDGAQARLVAVGMSLRAAEELMHSNPEAALAMVAEARKTSSRALDDLRDLVRGIYPPVLADRGLADAVRALALDAPLTVNTEISLPGEPPMPVAAAVYFAVAEALTNAVRHAGARTVEVSVEHADGMLRAMVTDDGGGGADASLGTGLAGVERRLATFDGILAVSSPAGGPTIVVIELPCSLQDMDYPRTITVEIPRLLRDRNHPRTVAAGLAVEEDGRAAGPAS